MSSSAPAPLVRSLRKAKPHRRRIQLACLCSVTNKLFDLAPPALIGAAIDVVVERQGSFVAGLGWVYDVITSRAVWIFGPRRREALCLPTNHRSRRCRGPAPSSGPSHAGAV